MAKGGKFVEVTKDKCYMIFAVYAKSIRDVETDKISISDKLLESFLPYIQVGVRYAKAIEQLNKSLLEFEKTHPKDTAEYEKKKAEYDKEIEELGKQTVQLDPLIPKAELIELIKKEPLYKLSSGQLYTLYNYETGENEDKK